MNPTILAAMALLTLGVAVYVFWLHDDSEAGEVKTRLAYLKERKEVVYENLRDLNFEYKAGKFPDSDYNEMKSSLEDEAAAILAEISRIELATYGLRNASDAVNRLSIRVRLWRLWSRYCLGT